MNTGENAHALHRIMDLTRFISIVLLLLHFYTACYPALKAWKCTFPILDKIIYNLSGNLFFMRGIDPPKTSSIILLIVSLIGTRGKKDDKLKPGPILTYIMVGLLLFYVSSLFLTWEMEATAQAKLYIITTLTGFLFFQAGGSRMTRLLFIRFGKDIFNDLNESFPQEEKLLSNPYSVNLAARYRFRGKTRSSWINIINPFRALLVLGTPGSGKTYFVIRQIITQHIQKGFTFFIYDYKFPDLTRIAYNVLLQNWQHYKTPPKFCIINFEDLERTHRCNAIPPAAMTDLADATESSRTIMLALNDEWAKKSGDFFVESPINFITAVFWYLRQYENGKYCTLPHAIEFSLIPYENIWPVMSMQPEILGLINPFISAYLQGAIDQLEGQIASAKIGMARLSSPELYYVLSGNDFSLDVNNPDAPKIVCAGNNPKKQAIYGAVLSLYIETLLRLVNKKSQLPCQILLEEFSTITVKNIDNSVAVARANLCAHTICIQDLSQLRKRYGKEQAEVIMNLPGNVISGQVVGDTAKMISDRIGKINQNKESISINTSDTSVSRSTQLDAAIPPSRITNLSSGEFVGGVADNPEQRIKLKSFHAEIVNDHAAIQQQEAAYHDLPRIRQVDHKTVMDNYYQIKKDIHDLIDREMKKIADNPFLKPPTEGSDKVKKSSVSR